MRIATSTIYDQQTSAIENQLSQYQTVGQQLSSGKSLNQPSDDPNVIGPDVLLHATIASETQDAKAATGLSNELTTVDSTLGALTNALQSARTLAVQGSSSVLTDSQRKDLGAQVDQLLSQVVALGNTQYAGRYLFAGSKAVSVNPVQAQGSPTSSVAFLGNQEKRTQVIAGQTFTANVTLQQAFNYAAADGSASVFDVLKRLRDTLDNDQIVDESATSINQKGSVIEGSSAGVTPTTIGAAKFAVPLTYDASGNATIQVLAVDAAGVQHAQNFTLRPTDYLDASPAQGSATPTAPFGTGTGAVTSLTQQINAWAASVGVKLTASFATTSTGAAGAQNEQRFTITSTSGAFFVKDVPSPGSTTAANLTSVLGLSGQVDVPQNLSNQIGDVDHVLQTALGARADVGARIQALSTLSGQIATFQTDNTRVQSGYEDTDVAKATSKFTQTQVALQAAYATTQRLESKTLLDYIT